MSHAWASRSFPRCNVLVVTWKRGFCKTAGMTYQPYGPIVVSTLYVNRPVHLPPLTAQAAFDTVRAACALPRAPDRWVLGTGSGELRAVGTGVLNHEVALGALRRVPGLLRRRAGPGSAAVEVELTAWSKGRCEIGLRPCGRLARTSDGWRQRRYLALALEAAEELVLRLEAVVDDWTLTQLVASKGNPELLVQHRR
jgi:hypothetical protein